MPGWWYNSWKEGRRQWARDPWGGKRSRWQCWRCGNYNPLDVTECRQCAKSKKKGWAKTPTQPTAAAAAEIERLSNLRQAEKACYKAGLVDAAVELQHQVGAAVEATQKDATAADRLQRHRHYLQQCKEHAEEAKKEADALQTKLNSVMRQWEYRKRAWREAEEKCSRLEEEASAERAAAWKEHVDAAQGHAPQAAWQPPRHSRDAFHEWAAGMLATWDAQPWQGGGERGYGGWGTWANTGGSWQAREEGWEADDMDLDTPGPAERWQQQAGASGWQQQPPSTWGTGSRGEWQSTPGRSGNDAGMQPELPTQTTQPDTQPWIWDTTGAGLPGESQPTGPPLPPQPPGWAQQQAEQEQAQQQAQQAAAQEQIPPPAPTGSVPRGAWARQQPPGPPPRQVQEPQGQGSQPNQPGQSSQPGQDTQPGASLPAKAFPHKRGKAKAGSAAPRAESTPARSRSPAPTQLDPNGDAVLAGT